MKYLFIFLPIFVIGCAGTNPQMRKDELEAYNCKKYKIKLCVSIVGNKWKSAYQSYFDGKTSREDYLDLAEKYGDMLDDCLYYPEETLEELVHTL